MTDFLTLLTVISGIFSFSNLISVSIISSISIFFHYINHIKNFLILPLFLIVSSMLFLTLIILSHLSFFFLFILILFSLSKNLFFIVLGLSFSSNPFNSSVFSSLYSFISTIEEIIYILAIST